MINTIITTVIGSLILLAIGLSLKIAQLIHRLHLITKENEDLRNQCKEIETKYTNFKETITPEHQKEISTLKKKISDLENNDGFASGANIR